MSLFFKKKKQNRKNSDELVEKRTEISSGGDAVEGLYGDDMPAPVNKRYKRAAVVVGISKYIVLTALFIFFMSMTFVYSSEITVENFRYILKDMNLKIPTGKEEYGDIYYVFSITALRYSIHGKIGKYNITAHLCKCHTGRKLIQSFFY